MDRSLFAGRLREVATLARTFGQKFLSEDLPEMVRYRVLLNQSTDHNLRSDEFVFPAEGNGPLDLTEQEVLDLLWRAGKVPEWIDVNVCDANSAVTVLEMHVCGRFTANDALLYHAQEGRPPFHVTSPPLPPGYREGERFSVRSRL